jgi:hypothetical protein
MSENVNMAAEVAGPCSIAQTSVIAPRFFIVRSTNASNIVISMKEGIWSSTRQGSAIFNDAFSSAGLVYLFFTVHKTARFSGVAVMQTPVSLCSPQE